MRPQPTATYPGDRAGLRPRRPDRRGLRRILMVSGVAGVAATVCCMSARPAAAAGAAAWQAIGPSGGSVYSFVVDPAAPRTVYAVGAWDLFKTVDGGGTWQRSDAGLLPGPIAAVVIDPRSPSRLYAAAGSTGSVFTSADGGASWTLVGRAGSFPLSCLAIDPQSPQILYAGGIYTSLSRSTDGGRTWTSVGNGLGLEVDSVAVDPRRPATIYAGTSAGVFKSVDRGATWQAASRGMSSPPPAVEAITIDPLEEGVVYAATFASFTPGGGVGGLYVSRNGGATWRLLPVPVPPNDPLGVTCLLISPAAGRPLYACAGGVARSTDNGRTWQRLDGGLGAAFIGSLALDPADPRRLYAGVTSGSPGPAVYKTENAGALWQPAGVGITAISSTALAALAGPAGSVLLGTAGAGVLKTTDDGAQWTPADTGLRGIDVLALAAAPSAPATVYTETNRAFFASTDGGATWTRPGARFAGGPPLVVDPQVSTTLYSVAGSSLYKSVDGGVSWALTYSWTAAGTPPPATALAVAPSDPSTLYLGANGSTNVLQVSHDAGATFQPLPASGQPTSFHSIDALAVDPGDPQTLYVAGPGSVPLVGPVGFVGTIWKSQDGGQTFTQLSLSLPDSTIDALLIDPAIPEVVYAANQYGFFLGGDVEVSRDAGATWNELAPGLPGASVLQLVLGPTGALYAGTDGASVYKLAPASD